MMPSASAGEQQLSVLAFVDSTSSVCGADASHGSFTPPDGNGSELSGEAIWMVATRRDPEPVLRSCSVPPNSFTRCRIPEMQCRCCRTGILRFDPGHLFRHRRRNK